MHYLCSDTYAGPQAFPGASASLTGETRSTALLAEELLEEQLPEMTGARPGAKSRDPAMVSMGAKVRRLRDLTEMGGGEGCAECERTVATAEGRRRR